MKKTVLLLISKADLRSMTLYIEKCIEDCLSREELPFSPSLYPKDIDRAEYFNRMIPLSDYVVVYTDFEFTQEIMDIITRAIKNDITVEYRCLSGKIAFTRYAKLEKILEEVSRKTMIPIDKLVSNTRKREVVDARFVYMRRAKEETVYSLATIGEVVHKDHASVLHGIKEASNTRNVVELYNQCFNNASTTKSEAPALEQVNQ